MKSQAQPTKRRPGRPLSFDREAALQKAMLVFWRHGYEASSLSELTAAMGVTPPSLYAAFGDKKRLFLEAVRRYMEEPDISEEIIRRAPTAHQAVVDFLTGAAMGCTQKGRPAGCLLSNGSTNCSPASSDVQRTMTRLRARIEKSLEERIRQGLEQGELAASADPAVLAAFFMSVARGMALQAQDGAKRERLLAVASAAAAAWPGVKTR